MKNGIAAAVLALGLAATATAEQAAIVGTQPQGSKDITITGCVVKGEGGYVLTGVSEETARAALAGGASAASGAALPKDAVGPGQVIYWLKDDDELEEHAGHRVEIEGKLEGDIEKGEIAAEIEEGMVELEFKVEGEKVTVKVPSLPVGTSGNITDKERTTHYVVRKLDVESVKTLANACQ
jgi:hypothetical protein